MKDYKESFINLYHGTTIENAKKIVLEQHFDFSDKHNWCGEGIYFYDNKSKAMWAADRKCREIYNQSGKKIKPAYVNVDIEDLSKKYICDLRTYEEIQNFVKVISEVLEKEEFDIFETSDEQETLILLRGILISYYAKEKGSKIVIGNFRQIKGPVNIDLTQEADKWQMVIGVETIYCVKDEKIITSIRGK